METRRGGDDELVPVGLRAAAGWTWRMVVVGVGIYLLLQLLDQFKVLVVPVLVAILLVALLRPLVELLTGRPLRGEGEPPLRRGLPRGLASLLTVLFALAVVAGLFTLIGQQISTGFDDLQTQVVGGWKELQRQLADSPLQLTNAQISDWIDQAASGLRGNSTRVVTGAVAVGSTAADIGTGFFLVLFSTYFFLAGGDRIWAWVVRLFPRTARQRVDEAGVLAWSTLTSYVRATMIVALTDGTGVAVVAALLGVPLALPLGVLVFLGAFVPVVGALISGIVAVLVALVAKGPLVALLMLAGVIAVQQIESHVLQPFLMGHAVRVHPLAVILAIGAGVLTAGVVGALFAVPLAAVINVVGSYLAGTESASDPVRDVPPDDGEPSAEEESWREPGEEEAVEREAGPLADRPEDRG
jgi:predicted PurR-regulated permease PerM